MGRDEDTWLRRFRYDRRASQTTTMTAIRALEAPVTMPAIVALDKCLSRDGEDAIPCGDAESALACGDTEDTIDCVSGTGQPIVRCKPPAANPSIGCA